MSTIRRRVSDPRKPISLNFTSEEYAAFDRVARDHGMARTVVMREAALAGLRLVTDRYRKQARNSERKGAGE